jgi:hypothetical protein
MALGAALASHMELLDPPIDGRLGSTPPKINQLPRVGSGAAERRTQRGSPT